MNAFIFFNADLSPFMESFVDIFCLAIFATPLIHAWVINPYIKERNELKESLRAHQITLEHLEKKQ